MCMQIGLAKPAHDDDDDDDAPKNSRETQCKHARSPTGRTGREGGREVVSEPEREREREINGGAKSREYIRTAGD